MRGVKNRLISNPSPLLQLGPSKEASLLAMILRMFMCNGAHGRGLKETFTTGRHGETGSPRNRKMPEKKSGS